MWVKVLETKKVILCVANNKGTDQGPDVQSIVSLTTSLRCKFVYADYIYKYTIIICWYGMGKECRPR